MEKWTIQSALHSSVQKYSDKPFLLLDDKSISFKDLDEISDRLASALLEEGFRKGDRLAIVALNQLEWLYTYFAATKIGVGLVALNVRYRESEFDYMLNNSKAKGLVSLSKLSDFNYADFFEGFRSSVPTVEKYIFIGKGFDGSLSFKELMNRKPNKEQLAIAEQQVKEEDTAIIIYTSGTTGRPKGTMITNRSILESAQAQVNHLNMNQEDRLVGHMPLNHVGGITCTINAALLSNASVVLIPNFTAESALQAIHHYRSTIFAGVPTMFRMLLNQAKKSSYDLNSIRVLIAGGSNVEPELCNQINKQFPNAVLVNLYGLSESSGACIISKLSEPIEKVQKSIGVAIGNFQVKVVDADRNEVKIGEEGELAVKGNCIAKGYFELEEESKNTFSEDGWLYTGDMVYVDKQGYIYFKGRKKEMYIQGGYNVYPVEIENLLTTHPKVSVAAGIGIEDSFFGEVGRYYIIPKEGVKVTAEELELFCQQHLADYKVPKQFEIVSSLPLTPAGKVQKALLKSEYMKNKVSY